MSQVSQKQISQLQMSQSQVSQFSQIPQVSKISPSFDTHRNYLKIRFSNLPKYPANEMFVTCVESILTSLEINEKMPNTDEQKCALLIECILGLLPLYRVDFNESFGDTIPITWHNFCVDIYNTQIREMKEEIKWKIKAGIKGGASTVKTGIKIPYHTYLETLKYSLGLTIGSSLNSPEFMFYEYTL